MLGSVLIANRGEIALRVLRTCRRLGIRSVAVYSDADAQALHVRLADQAVRIGPPPATQSYLDGEAIIAAAQAAGVEAIHPGYGFLSENAAFAQACLDAGLVWIGPPPAAMQALGDKARAKALAERCGVPVLPGYHGDDQSSETLLAAAAAIGFPVLIKASAGGGGRGMRVVETPDDFIASLQAAQREAASSFGDDRVLLERFVRRPRHVEFQIIGDRHGNLIHLGERECSVQRRHQKLIEESPSPVVDAELRQRMGQAALTLARAAGYWNAGTVEFLLDEQRRFAFLEVNARLQVEHPVTEALTGLDLVELQLRVAAGEALPVQQAEVQLRGHAIEARVIAEDALASWAPSSGVVEHVAWSDLTRVDSWLEDGTLVSPYYDSLLAKLIAFGADRPAAIARLRQALELAELRGVQHNLDLLLAVVEHPAFSAGDLHTGFLDEHGLIATLADLPVDVLAAAAAARRRPPGDDPWRSAGAWRLGRVDQPLGVRRAGRLHRARVAEELLGGGLQVTADGRVVRAEPHLPHVTVDGEGAEVRPVGEDHLLVHWRGRGFRLEPEQPVSLEQARASSARSRGAGGLVAPMPGRVVKLDAAPGQRVDANQPLVVLEAMKMEHVVEAPRGGVVQDIHVAVGDQVPAGALLLELTVEEAE